MSDRAAGAGAFASVGSMATVPMMSATAPMTHIRPPLRM